MIDAVQFGDKVRVHFSAQGLSQTITLDVDAAHDFADRLDVSIDDVEEAIAERESPENADLERRWRE